LNAGTIAAWTGLGAATLAGFAKTIENGDSGSRRASKVFGATVAAVRAVLINYKWDENVSVLVHKKLVPFIDQAKGRVPITGYAIKSMDGFYWRYQTGSDTQLSKHSWGIAIDINAATNPYRADNRLVTDMPASFVTAMKDSGFSWGGNFKWNKDPMHFELAPEYWELFA